jgi:hypothetical protein
MPARQQKITFAEMRAAGVHGLLVYCPDYQCSHWTAISTQGGLEPNGLCGHARTADHWMVS